jgi:hypothetical protein
VFLQVLATTNDLYAILSVQAILRAAIRTDCAWCAFRPFERMSCGPAVFAIAHRAYNRRTNDLKASLAAPASCEAKLLVFSHIVISDK